MAVHEADANRSRDRTRLTGRLQGHHHYTGTASPQSAWPCARSSTNAFRDGWRAGRRCCDSQRRSVRQPAINRSSVFILAPDRARRAGVADRPCFVHGPERQWVVDATEQTVDLDRGWAARDDADVTDGAASNPTGSRDAASVVTPLDRMYSHGFAPVRARPCGVQPPEASGGCVLATMARSYHSFMPTVSVAAAWGAR